MPQDSLRSILYRSFVTCDDPKGVVECRTIRRSETMEPKKDEVKDQLLEVSRRAHKLNHATDSCSNSKDAARDLLKGALDLQDSLHMLGKLQEASHYMAKLKKKKKKKEKEKWDSMRNDQVIRRTNSSPVGDRTESRLSAYASSRDCIEELREVIRDSLARQNLLPNINVEEKRCFSGRFPNFASTSSSQSSTLPTHNFTSMDSSISLAALKKKARGPSLVAKLMGLEEMPSKPLQTNSQKELKCKKIFVQEKHIFEISRPKARKSQFVVQEGRTMKDILENMHFKGLLKSNFIKEIKYDSHQWSDFFSEQKLINNSPPIVLIKPRLNPCLQPQDNLVPFFMEKKLKVKEEPPSIDSNSRASDFNEMRTKVEAEETPIKRLSSREGAKDIKDKVAMPVKSEAKIKERRPTKMKLKKETTHKKTENIPKPVTSSAKLVNKEVAKAKNSSRSKDETKVTPTKSSKLENGSNITKYKMPCQRIATANSSSSCELKIIVCATDDRKRIPKRKEKPVSKATTTAKITTEKLEYKGDGILLDGKKVNLSSENDNVLEEDCTETVDWLPTKEGTERTDILIGEHHDNSESYVCDVTLVTTDDQNSRNPIGDIDDDPIMPIGTDSESNLRGTRLKALLLRSPAFLNHAEELFYHVNLPTPSQELRIDELMDANTRLSLDCANEIVRQRSFPDSQMVPLPLLSVDGNAKSHISLDHLLKEISDGMEALRSYSEGPGENYLTGSLYSMLERDLKHKEVLSGIWDLGWRNGFSVNDMMQVVLDIEKQLLSGLIEEICA